MTNIHAKASCLCGSVTFEAEVGEKVGACHCDICRKWGGGPLFALDSGNDLEISGKANVVVFDSTAWAERAFCSVCGSHLYIRVKSSGRYIVPAGLFDLDTELTFDHQIFIDKKPSYYCFANETMDSTGEEVFAQFTQPEG